MITLRSKNGEILEFDIPNIKIGTDPKAHVQTQNGSRMHAILEVDGDKCTLIDLGSSPPTEVNGNKVNKVTLKLGDVIAIAGEEWELVQVMSGTVDYVYVARSPLGNALSVIDKNARKPGTSELIEGCSIRVEKALFTSTGVYILEGPVTVVKNFSRNIDDVIEGLLTEKKLTEDGDDQIIIDFVEKMNAQDNPSREDEQRLLYLLRASLSNLLGKDVTFALSGLDE